MNEQIDPRERAAGGINEIALIEFILAEKRTFLSILRTGISIFALPLGVLSLLIATSKNYDIVDVLHLMIPLLLLNLGLIIVGAYLIIRSISRIRHHDHMITELKQTSSGIGRFID